MIWINTVWKKIQRYKMANTFIKKEFNLITGEVQKLKHSVKLLHLPPACLK